MIQVPEKLALEIELLADEALEKAKEHFPLNSELWNSLENLKEDILEDLCSIGGKMGMEMVLQDPELKEHLKNSCVRLGLIRRLERYANPDFVPPTIV